MKYADTNRDQDSTLRSIEAPTEQSEDDETSHGFGIPGQIGVISFFRLADIGNEDGNSTRLTALGDQPKDHIDLEGQPPVVKNEGLASVSPGSLSTIINGVNEGSKMSLSARIAYVMENGEPFCNHCERNFVPASMTRIACTNCGCGRPNDDHGAVAGNFSGSDLHLENVEGPTAGDLDAGRDIVKEEANTRQGSVDEYLGYFNKVANDSELYSRGYMEAQEGKPLDEDLALLSDDYYNGYESHKFYNKTPQQSVGQNLFDIKPNSNAIPRGGDMTPGEADAGPLQLTDGFNRATASKFASVFPVDVIQKFFEI